MVTNVAWHATILDSISMFCHEKLQIIECTLLLIFLKRQLKVYD